MTPTSEIVTGGYEAFYGLQECPFDLEPDARMVCDSLSYQTTLDETIRAIGSDTPLIVVTGDAGTGKTLVCRALREELSNNVLLCESAGPPSSSGEFLAWLTSELNRLLDGSTLPSDMSRRGLLTFCGEFLTRLDVHGACALIVVDEAHQLPPDVLEDMSHLLGRRPGDRRRLQIILVGRPELGTLLERPEAERLAEYETKRLELRPLRGAEVGRYVDRRLWVAQRGAAALATDASGPDPSGGPQFGTAGEPFWQVRFTASAIRRVAELSGGVPVLVNLLCDRALQAGLAHRKRRIGAREVLAAAHDLRLAVPLGLRFAGTGRYLALSVGCLCLALAMWRVSALNANGRSDIQISDSSVRVPDTNTRVASVGSAGLPTATVPEVIGPLEDANGFLILAASPTDETSAMSVTDRLLGLGLPAFSRATSAGGQQVVVGPYLSFDEAADARRRLPVENLRVPEIISVTSTLEE